MFLGIDLGTSGLRALLVTEDGTPVTSAEAPFEAQHPHPGWSEQDPTLWITAFQGAMDTIAAQHPEALRQLRGIGIAGHMHGAVLLGDDTQPLRPCILWNDTRAHAEAATLDTPQMRAITGNIVFPGFTAPKLMWVAAHEPEIFAKVATVCLPKDHLTRWLTGARVADISDAAGTSWLDTGARSWSDTALAASGMTANQMPGLVEGAAAAGTLKPDLAARWGIEGPVTVAGGGADNAAAACGAGALAEGDAVLSLGTSGVLMAARDGYQPAPDTAVHTFCHAVPDRWYQMGVILAATDSLNWLSRQTGRSPADLTAALGDTLDGPGTVRFLPYLSGERTPHNDSRIRGAFLNLDIGSGPEDLTRAVLEGVAFALRDSQEALRGAGARFDRALAIGGGTGSAYWVELCATVLDLPLDLPAKGEFGAAMGAARLAICAATGASPDDVMTKPDIARTVHPRAELTQSYADAYAAWRATYPALKDLP